MNWTTLRQQIEQHFDEAELRTLCFDLGVSYENLGGRGKGENVTELVALFQRNGQVDDLMEQLNHHRPAINWKTPKELPFKQQPLTGFSPIPATPAERRIRNDFLQKLKANWIQGILEKSLHNILRLDLGFTYRPEAISRSWSITLQQSNLAEQELPENVSILEIFRQHQRELLILGEPGAGKTITLLELARDLIQLADADETQSIPVVLNLSSWAEKQQSLVEWLQDMLLREYQVSRKVSHKWITTDYQLTLLLDGLDEVQQEHREACVAAINDFRAEYLADIVICSRVTDYEDLNTGVNIATAIMLRPLTLQQIDTYLAAGGDSLATLREILKEDAAFQALAQTPLLLSMMAMTYPNQPLQAIHNDSNPSDQRSRLFSQYVQYMFTRQGLRDSEIQKNNRRLSWIARHMVLRTQSTFSLDTLQKSWLPSKVAQYSFVIMVGIGYWLLTTILTGFIFSSFALGAFIAIISGAIGLGIASENEIDKKSFRDRLREIKIPQNYSGLFHFAAFGFGTGAMGLLKTPFFYSIFLGAAAGFIYWFIRSRKDVKFFLAQGVTRRNLPRILGYIAPDIGIGAYMGLVGFALGEYPFNSGQILLLGMFLSLAFWEVIQLLYILGRPIFALLTYFENYCRHFMLRLFLALNDILPLQANHFLDEMMACGLIRKSGNNHLFVHILLRDHFASSTQNTKVFLGELSRFDVSTLRKTGEIHREHKRFTQALICFNRAIELQPKWASIFHERGVTYQEMEEYDAALADFNRAIELKPKWAGNFQERGITFREMEEYDAALADFNRAIELEPKWASNFQQRGITFRKMEEYEAALADFNRAIELQPKGVSSFQQRGITFREMEEYEAALADFNRAIELQPNFAWPLLLGRGITFREMEEYDVALADFNRAIELEPKGASNFQQRGITFREMEEYEAALADFNRAIELEPKWASNFAERGINYREMEEFKVALIDFNHAIELQPNFAWPLLRERGITFREMEEYNAALADFNRAIELQPKGASNFRERGVTYREMGKYEMALADFNRAVELDPKWSPNLRGRGVTCLLLDNTDDAKADFQKAIALIEKVYERYPQNSGLALNLAFYHLTANHENKARTLYQHNLNVPTYFLKRALRQVSDFLDIFPDHSHARAIRMILQDNLNM
ncbi:MAG: tetratricopeptide repeat protein [Anaerolineaceae bacterium]|nr:tetratricopeptide repeat protein [Anaerolineaceae bacterium]